MYALWSDRQIAALGDDPTLAERLFANRTRSGAVIGVCMALVSFAGGLHFIWGWSVLLIARIAAGYPASRRLHQETWTLGGYLSFFGRLIVAIYGYWMLVAATPALISAAAPREGIAAATLTIVLIAWAWNFQAVASAILRAHPIDDAALVARFTRMVDACGLRHVTLKQVDVHGGVFANAVALPSSRRPTVLVSSTLVERFDEDEVAAVLAHELAHIEHFNPRRLRQLSAISLGLIAAATLTVSVVSRVAPGSLATVLWGWPVLVFVAIMLRAARQQVHETPSDLRAVALTGDPGAMIRALIKLHATARLPRRWDPEVERRATHPSLARRIQAIEAAAGHTAAPLDDAATFHAAEGTASVTLSDGGVSWSEDAATRHTLAYSSLTTLRVEAGKRGEAQLVAMDAGHRRWSMRLRPEDVTRVQAVLDVVDTRLGAVAPRRRLAFGAPRVVAWITLILAIAYQQLGLVFLCSLALAWPAVPVLVATATAAVAGAGLLTWREHTAFGSGSHPRLALTLIVCAVALLAFAARQKREDSEAAVAWLIGAMASAAAFLWLLIALSGLHPIDLHASARQWPAAGVLTLSVAAAIAVSKARRSRYATVPVAVAGCVALFLGSKTFADRFVADPFLVPALPYAITTIDAPPMADVAIPFEASDLRLSPGGRYLAVSSEDEDEEITIHAGAINGPLSSFVADDAWFAGEGRLLVLLREKEGSMLRLTDLAANQTLWSLPLPVAYGRLAVDAASQRWSLVGWNHDRAIVEASGTIGSGSFAQHIFDAPRTPGTVLQPIAAGKRRLLAMQREWQNAPFGATTLGRLLHTRARTRSTLSLLDGRERTPWMTSHLDVQCEAFGFQTGAAICSAFDGDTTRLVMVNVLSGQRDAMGALDGRFFHSQDAGEGWIAGWSRQGALLIQPHTRTAIRIGSEEMDSVDYLTIAGATIGALTRGPDGSRVRLYAYHN